MELSKQDICHKATYKQHIKKMSKQYLDFWLCNGKKPGGGDDVTFLKCNLLTFKLSYVKTNKNFVIQGKTGQYWHIFVGKF